MEQNQDDGAKAEEDSLTQRDAENFPFVPRMVAVAATDRKMLAKNAGSACPGEVRGLTRRMTTIIDVTESIAATMMEKRRDVMVSRLARCWIFS